MLRRLRIRDGKLIETDAPGGEIHVYIAPDAGERKQLVDEMGVDEHTLGSALDPDELSRLEFEPEHIAIIYKRPRNYSSDDQFLFRVISTGLFLFKDRLVVVLAEDAPLFDGKQFTRILSLHEVVLKLIFRSIFHFEEHLKVINQISVSLEKEINTAMENKHLIDLFTLEKSLVYYVNAISCNAVLMEKLRNNAAKIGFVPESLEFLDDTIIENNQCHEQANIYSNILASLMDARASIVANNLNVLMKNLNLIMIALMLPTLVVSIFSMNVALPLAQQHALSFWVVMALAVASAVSVGVIWRRKRLGVIWRRRRR